MNIYEILDSVVGGKDPPQAYDGACGIKEQRDVLSFLAGAEFSIRVER